MIFVDEGKCSACGLCLEACPQDAIVLGESGAAIDHDLCTGCAACLDVCPQGAIYAVEAAPVPLATAPSVAAPGRQTPSPHQPTRTETRPVIASALATAVPLTIDVLAALTRRWLDQRSLMRRADSRSGGGCRRRWRGGRRC
jgi:Fe-S-cluster-containing hydrogenase component 2